MNIKDQNQAILLAYHNNGVRRRITKELEKMYPLYKSVEVLILADSTLCVIVKDVTHKYEFVIRENYPFVSPTIFFQNRPYAEFLRISSATNVQALFKKITGNECLCCHSLNCFSNWSPAATLIRIVDEIREIMRIKRCAVNKLLADKIKSRYLMADIDLDSWLF